MSAVLFIRATLAAGCVPLTLRRDPVAGTGPFKTWTQFYWLRYLNSQTPETNAWFNVDDEEFLQATNMLLAWHLRNQPQIPNPNPDGNISDQSRPVE